MLSRRLLLRSSLGALALLPLAACSRRNGPVLLSPTGQLPKAWSDSLPAPWALQEAARPQAVLDAVQGDGSRPALVALSDAWASSLAPASLAPGLWQPLQAPALLARLAAAAAPVSRLYGAPDAAPVAFPWALSPWVLALRSQPELVADAQQSWQVLLDARLKGKLVLPSSPRISIELMGADPTRLRQLRGQALAYDEAQGLNLLLNGEARAAVLPLQRLIPLLRRDPRLQVVLPASGAPLTWQLLLRPAGSAVAPPLDWMGQVLNQPLLSKLLVAGWLPPLPRAELSGALAKLPRAVAKLLLPSDAVLQRCWSLPPLPASQRLAWQTLWDASAP